MTYFLLGLITLAVVAVWMVRTIAHRRDEALRLRCPECGGDLRGYEDSFTCPHCYSVLDDPGDEDASIDEEDAEWDEEDDAHPLA